MKRYKFVIVYLSALLDLFKRRCKDQRDCRRVINAFYEEGDNYDDN